MGDVGVKSIVAMLPFLNKLQTLDLKSEWTRRVWCDDMIERQRRRLYVIMYL